MSDMRQDVGLDTLGVTESSPNRWTPPSGFVILGSVFLLAIVILVALLPFTPWYEPRDQDVSRQLLGPFTSYEGSFYLLGTDQLGRDVLSRLALGGSVALRLSFGALVIAVSIGTTAGLIAGHFGGWTDRVVTALGDMQLAIPRILIMIAAIAVLPRSLLLLTVLLGASSWVPYARVVRSGALTLENSEFVLAARAAGASSRRIMLRHLLPHLYSNIVIIAAIDLGAMVMLEAALSFLGLGVTPPATSWGLQVFDAQTYLSSAPHLVILPGTCIFLLVAGINFVSQHFTDERHN